MPDFTETADSTLLTAWRSGDAKASAELVRRHYRSIYLFFFSKVGKDVAQDLTQAAFETLCKRQTSFRGDATVRTYLFGIARWTLVHHHRKQRGSLETFDPSVDPMELAEEVASATSRLAARREEMLFIQAMRELPLDDQIVLELKYYDGMTVRDLAAVFEIPRATMADRVTRARTRLAKIAARLGESPQLVESTISGLDSHMKAIRRQLAARLEKS